MLWSHSRWNHYIQVLETNVFRISACLKQHLSPNPGTKVETVRPPKLCRQRCHKLKLALYFFLTSWKFISRSRCSRADVVLLSVKVPDSFPLVALLFRADGCLISIYHFWILINRKKEVQEAREFPLTPTLMTLPRSCIRHFSLCHTDQYLAFIESGKCAMFLSGHNPIQKPELSFWEIREKK